MSLIETNLKTLLSLQGIYRGNLAWLPPTDISTMVNGVWLNLEKPVTIEEVAQPKGLQFTYRIRIIFVRRIDTTNNVLDTKIDDANLLAELVYDNIKPNFSLVNGQILWWLVRQLEYEPAEDNFVNALSADMMAVVIETELVLRTKIG